jgi:hypothetical protein
MAKKNAASKVTKWLRGRKQKLARDVAKKTTKLEVAAAKKKGNAREKAAKKRK